MPATVAWLILVPLACACATAPVTRFTSWLGRLCDGAVRVPLGAEALVFVAALLLGATPMLLGAVHPPSTHDEFAYLLAADTFLHGRLSNPTPPLWEHFETFHQIMVPTYASKFPPGQGAALALGALLGAPIAGAWGTVALACAAVCWMLRGALPPRWAILGGLLAAAHPTVFWWGQTYWGGGVAMLGGALVGGALVRTLDRPKTRWGVVAGVGLAILANSRPFEGTLVGAMLLVIVAFNERARLRLFALRTILPIALVLAPVTAWMGYYNWRVTGDALTMPYLVHARQYMTAPLLWFQDPPPRPQFRHEKMRQYHEGFEFNEYNEQRTPAGFARGVWNKVRTIATNSFAPPTLAVALLGLPWLLKRRHDTDGRARRAALIALAVCLAFPLLHVLLTPWLRVQYLAPAVGLFVLLLVVSMRGAWASHRAGAALVRAVLVLQLVATVWVIVQMANNPNPPGIARQQLMDRLAALPGQHLVIVRYSAAPQSMFEWVYNAADIERSRVVFARHIGDAGTARLLEHFGDRRAWVLDVDGMRYTLDELRPPGNRLN